MSDLADALARSVAAIDAIHEQQGATVLATAAALDPAAAAADNTSDAGITPSLVEQPTTEGAGNENTGDLDT